METAALRQKLASIGQGQALQFFDGLDPSGQQKLAAQVAALDLHSIQELADTHVRQKPHIDLPVSIHPVEPFPIQADAQRRQLYADAAKRGRELLAQGKVGAFLVAGGQGTRLGYDGPKGEYPVTPIKKKPLFQVFAEQLLAHGKRAGKPVPWYIMTSDINDAPTRAFFKQHDNFGVNSDDLFFFPQGMMPAFDMGGKLLLAEKDSLALSPDGHGGSLRALEKSGAIRHMRARGVEHLSYFQVDNPLVHCIDPLFLGLHDLTGSEMSSKTVPKVNAMEKVGNFVVGDGAVQVIEYSDLPQELATQTNADGTPRFNNGSIAIHALRVSFVERLNASGRLELPWHRAEKKVPFVDSSGNLIKPSTPNAVKLEQFVFDAIPLAKNAMVYRTDRAEEFSPVKNAEGVDSPATCTRDQIRRAARWLQSAGVEVASKDGEPASTLEIAPSFALNAQDIAAKRDQIQPIVPGSSVYLA